MNIDDYRQCDVTSTIDSGPHRGRLYCNLPHRHTGGWHHMCHAGTNYVVFYLITNCNIEVAQ
jgi:hypothetical protein